MSKTATTSLSSLLTPQTVRARISVSSWQEAVDCVGQLLVGSGSAEPRYIEAMKRVLREMGAYAVLAPGVVLLHARPEDGVRRPCLALATLATPVPFGHSENDPVDIVLAMGAVDKHAHVNALRHLALLLGDAAALRRLREASSDRQLLSVVRSWKPLDHNRVATT
jgi:mannitol/fructose-specific phosphotransferase system IIA component (Ntr-type)